MIELGQKAHDKITGFTGIITAKVTYISGCDQYCLQPPVDEKGEARDGKYFDEQRIVVEPAAPALALDNAGTGDGADIDNPAPQK